MNPKVHEMTSRGDAEIGRGDTTMVRPPGMLRRACVVALGLVVAWAIVTRTFVAYLALRSPQAAIAIAPGDPVALLRLAEIELLPPEPERSGPQQRVRDAKQDAAAAASPVAGELTQDLARVRARAEQALEQEPMSERAIRILGQLAEHEGDKDTALSLYKIAASRSLHESYSTHRMLVHSLENSEWGNAVSYADALLRTRLELAPALAPLIAGLADHPKTRSLLVERLAAKPNWRPALTEHVLERLQDPQSALDIILGLVRAGDPPTAYEQRLFYRYLFGRKQEELAYYAWLQMLPAEHLAVAGSVFNGGFDFPTKGTGFDWAFQSGSSFTVGMAKLPEQPTSMALKIELGPGRVQGGYVRQRMLLTPGRYTLTLRVRGELSARKGLKWAVSCADNEAELLGETPVFIGSQRSWRNIAASFEVPAKNCRSQFVKIVHDARFAAEQFASGIVWYDDVSVTSEATTPTDKN